MTDESVFRSPVIVHVALILPIGLYNRIRSQAAKEKLARKNERICWNTRCDHKADPKNQADARLGQETN
jgi:hypothetical protein